MRSGSILAASALLATGVSAVPAPAPAPPASAQLEARSAPITIPIHRRAGAAKRDLASFERKVAHMKARYGAKKGSSGGSDKEKRAGSVTLTNFQDR